MAVKRNFSTALYVIVSFFSVIVLIWLALRFSPYPELRSFTQRPDSVRYYDRNGILLQITPLAGGLRREKPEMIPPEIRNVFVFAEDRRFFSHFGVDLFALARALFQNLTGGRSVSGASTITMQLARLISLEARKDDSQNAGRRETSLGRKIGEALNALRLEARLSKDQILEMYLNSLPFGFNAEGVASAARTFYSSDLSMLSPAQIFCLAVIPRRPGFYNPLENGEICAAAATELHARFSLDRKFSRDFPLLADIHGEDWNYAIDSARRFSYPFEVPHLVRYLNNALVSVMAADENKILRGRSSLPGEIRLSVDLGLQRHLENAIAGNVSRHVNERITNGAALVIDNHSGEILAWVGSADFFSTRTAGQIDGVLALNQPGSSMKPFLYAMALENGFLPTDVLADVPMSFGETELYLPRNFNNRFNGPMLLRASLASSLNVPAVYLLYRLGVMNYSRTLFSLGFESLRESAQDAGLGLALGNAPVSLRELVRAFSVFPRDGVYIPLTAELVTGDLNAREYDSGEISSGRIFSEDSARLICSMLSDSGARVLAFGSGRNFRTSFPAIFKTGTANQYQSIVALGATPRYTAGVWMGNFTGETVIGRTGSSIPAAIVRDALEYLVTGRGFTPFIQNDFALPKNWEQRRVCALSGMAPAPACLSVIDEYVQHGEAASPCTWHYLLNGRSEVVYPAEYQAWFNSAARQGYLDYGSRQLEIINPRDGYVYLSSPGIGRDEIPVEVIGGSEDTLAVTYDNQSFSVSRPFVFYLDRKPGFHILRVRSGTEETAVSFTIE